MEEAESGLLLSHWSLNRIITRNDPRPSRLQPLAKGKSSILSLLSSGCSGHWQGSQLEGQVTGLDDGSCILAGKLEKSLWLQEHM